jgi:hypothetical protein
LDGLRARWKLLKVGGWVRRGLLGSESIYVCENVIVIFK